MNYLKKVKECGLAVLAVNILIGLLFLIKILPFELNVYINFLVCSILITFGESLFLVGVESSIMNMGKLVGGNIKKFKSIWLIFLIGFVMGFVCTISEPDILVFINSITGFSVSLTVLRLLISFSLGVGLMTVVALVRLLKKINYKYIMLVSYGAILFLTIFTPLVFVGVSFDGSGVTTGPITVPILLAFSAGIAEIKTDSSSEENSFGMVGLVSVGPIIIMMILGIILGNPINSGEIAATETAFLPMFLKCLKDSALAIVPICLILVIFNFIFIKLPKKALFKMLLGAIFSFLGLFLFLFGISFGLASMGNYLGSHLGANLSVSGQLLTVLIFIILGFVIVFTEPAIGMLTKQVNDVTNGLIKKKFLYLTIGIGIALSLVLGLIRVYFEINILWIILPFIICNLIMMFFVPKLFVPIAFDSGGVATGSMVVGFLLPILIGVCTSSGANVLSFAFGFIGIIATVPIFCILVLGLIYKLKTLKAGKMKNKSKNLKAGKNGK